MAVCVLFVLSVLLAFGGGISGRVEQASEVSWTSRRFMDHLMSMNGCGRFAGLVNATKIFHYSLAHGGLVVFCPDDKALAAFEPSFNDLCADGQLAVLLYHGVAPASLTVPTLADLANRGYGLTIRHRGDAMEILPLSSSGGVARVTKKVADEEVPLVVYLVDAVLLSKEPIQCGDSGFDGGRHWLDVLGWVIARIAWVIARMQSPS